MNSAQSCWGSTYPSGVMCNIHAHSAFGFQKMSVCLGAFGAAQRERALRAAQLPGRVTLPASVLSVSAVGLVSTLWVRAVSDSTPLPQGRLSNPE